MDSTIPPPSAVSSANNSLTNSSSSALTRPFERSLLPSLSGIWNGNSTPYNQPNQSTNWTDCRLTFNLDGSLAGTGQSVWRNEIIHFILVGTVRCDTATFELYKTHTGKYTNTIVYNGIIRIDSWPFRMEGNYRSGQLILARTSDLNHNTALQSTTAVSTAPKSLTQSHSNTDLSQCRAQPNSLSTATNSPENCIVAKEGMPNPAFSNANLPALLNSGAVAPPVALTNVGRSASAPVTVPQMSFSQTQITSTHTILGPGNAARKTLPSNSLHPQLSNTLSLLSGVYNGTALNKPGGLTKLIDVVIVFHAENCNFSSNHTQRGSLIGFGTQINRGTQRIFRLVGNFELNNSNNGGSAYITLQSLFQASENQAVESLSYSLKLDKSQLSLRGEGINGSTIVLAHSGRYSALPAAPAELIQLENALKNSEKSPISPQFSALSTPEKQNNAASAISPGAQPDINESPANSIQFIQISSGLAANSAANQISHDYSAEPPNFSASLSLPVAKSGSSGPISGYKRAFTMNSYNFSNNNAALPLGEISRITTGDSMISLGSQAEEGKISLNSPAKPEGRREIQHERAEGEEIPRLNSKLSLLSVRNAPKENEKLYSNSRSCSPFVEQKQSDSSSGYQSAPSNPQNTQHNRRNSVDNEAEKYSLLLAGIVLANKLTPEQQAALASLSAEEPQHSVEMLSKLGLINSNASSPNLAPFQGQIAPNSGPTVNSAAPLQFSTQSTGTSHISSALHDLTKEITTLAKQSSLERLKAVAAAAAAASAANGHSSANFSNKLNSPSHNSMSAASSVSDSLSSDDHLCKICYENVANCVLLPCGHVGFCMACSRQCPACPACRQPITEAKVVYKA
jgi:rubrerythrin